MMEVFAGNGENVKTKESRKNSVDSDDDFNPEYFGLIHDPGVMRFDVIDYEDMGTDNERTFKSNPIFCKFLFFERIFYIRKLRYSLSLSDINISCL